MTPRIAGLVPFIVASILLSACSESETPDQRVPERKVGSASPVPTDLPQGSGFDFYVLALSWSPTYCLHEGREDRNEFGRDRQFLVENFLGATLEPAHPFAEHHAERPQEPANLVLQPNAHADERFARR